MKAPETFDINGGNNQIVPNATQAVQHNYYNLPASTDYPTVPKTVVILGAGVDATLGMPASSHLIPGIVDYLETDEGRAVDACLRKLLKRLTFRFDKFVHDAIDRLAKDLDRERDTICRNIRQELEQNPTLDGQHRKMGELIVRIFQKITDVKNGASIDAETEELVREVLGIELTEQTIIDFSRLNYTETFKAIIVEILQKSMRDAENPVLRHVYKNLLDIEQLLSQYFYGFFTGTQSQIKTYLYISWVLWAFLVHEEQAAVARLAERAGTADSTPQRLPVYGQLSGKDVQVITFNYTSFAAHISPTALYFNGTLIDYVDIENKNELHFDSVVGIDIADFFHTRLPMELSLESDRLAIPIPSFMPPLKLKPVISKQYITTWYRTDEAIRHAERILILGHSIHANDTFFNDLLRDNRRADIVIIDRDMENVCRNLCTVLQQSPNRYTTLSVQQHPARKYDNRITVVQADLKEIDLSEWLK